MLTTRRIGAHLTRSVLGTSGAYLFIFALSLAPVADVIAMSFSRGIFIVVLAVLVLGESVGWRRWTACIVGFIGVLVMVRPGFGELNWGLFAAAGDAVLSGAVALYFGAFSALFSMIPAILVWRWPSSEAWSLLLMTGVLATCGQFFVTRAWTEGEASILAPLAYVQLVLSGG